MPLRLLLHVLAENASGVQHQRNFGNKTEFHISSHPRNTVNSMAGGVVVFDWKIVSGHTATQLFQEVKRMMINRLKIQPQDSQDCTVFITIYNDIDWTKKEKKLCLRN